ncbi:hypothetical protein V502_10745 [Pseudogymnoascus sp. VKM F-4520 (FW-2644)]|nr:hypothetical protein V502_10745 [Pseudogymnoascus sp. VKM F-4520 (FW-2644)]
MAEQIQDLTPRVQRLAIIAGETSEAPGTSVTEDVFTGAMRRQSETLARRSATLTEVAAARARNEIIEIDEGQGGGTGEVQMGGAARATDETIAIEEDDEGGTGEAQMRAETPPPRRRRRRFARCLLSSGVGRRAPRRPPADWEVHDHLWKFLSTPIDRRLWRDMDLNIQAETEN